MGGTDAYLEAFIAATKPVRAGDRPPDGILRVPDARCDWVRTASGAAEGMIRGRRGRALVGPSDLIVPSWGKPIGGRRRRSDRPVLVLELRSRAADNYFHWHIDALVNVWLHQQADRESDQSPSQLPSLLVPIGSHDWQTESLESAGIDPSRIVRLEPGDRLDVAEFLLPVRPFGSREVPPWVVQGLRELTGWSGVDPGSDEPARRRRTLLHVRREGTARRRVQGEEALARSLRRLGFVDLLPSSVPVAEQRRAFWEADVIVAAHGAALTNLAWAQPGARVVELMSVARPNLAFHNLSGQAGLHHVGVLCEVASGVSAPHADIIADRELILRVLETELESR